MGSSERIRAQQGVRSFPQPEHFFEYMAHHGQNRGMHSTIAVIPFAEAAADAVATWAGALAGAASGVDAEVHAMSGEIGRAHV